MNVSSIIFTAFEKHLLFRKLCIIYILVYMWVITDPTIQLAKFLASSGYTGTENSLVIGAVFGLPLAVIGYMFKLYTTARNT